MNRIRAVTFDAGSTLIEPWPSVGAVYAEVAAEFGFRCEAEKLTAEFYNAWQSRSGFAYSRDEWFEVVQHSFRETCDVSRKMFEAIYERFSESRCWRIYDDVIPALEQLKARGFRLAVISNWDDRLVSLLQSLGLAKHFEAIVVSALVGAHKPSPKIFRHAAALLEVAPADILHIGDSQSEDIIGARAAGFQARRIRRSGAVEAHDIHTLTSHRLEQQIPQAFP
jgi:putative hydrolase of the HAD superfamily